jgi:hypothetical protein
MSSDCFGYFWEEDEPQCKNQCQKYQECLHKFALETLPQLQAENPGMEIGDDFEKMSGVTVASLQKAVAYRTEKEKPVLEPESNQAELSFNETEPVKKSQPVEQPTELVSEDAASTPVPTVENKPVEEKPKRKRGRPPKKKNEKEEITKPKRKRGRPPKKKSEDPPPGKEVKNPPLARAAKAATVRAKQKTAASVKRVMDGESKKKKQKDLLRWRWSPKHNKLRNQREKDRNSYIARLRPGMKLRRFWKGQTHEVIVLKRSYRYRGREYPTLQSITTEIVGTKPYPKQQRLDGTIPPGVRYLCPWSAIRFFRLPWIMGPQKKTVKKKVKKKSRKSSK